VPRQHIKTFERVNGTEHLLQRASVRLKLVAQSLSVTDEAMTASRETLPVDLIPVPQSRLHHTVTAVDLQHQAMNVWNEVFFHLREMRRHDAAQQQPTQTRRWVNRQHQVTKRQTSGWRMGTRVEDFDFRKQL
jgi:hypothetical protein